MLTTFDDDRARRFRQEAREWIGAAIPDEWRAYTGPVGSDEALKIRHGWDRLVYDGGYAGLSWPEEFGGRGLGVIEEAIFLEECALAGAPEGLSRIGRGLAGSVLMTFGSKEQQARFLDPILSAEEIWCEGLSEPDAGSDLAAIQTTATPVDGGYRIDGHKVWTSYAHYAQFCMVLAKTNDGRRHHNLGVFVADMSDPGLTRSPIRQMNEDKDFNELTFDGVMVPAERAVGDLTQGWRMVQHGLRVGAQGSANSLLRYLEIRRQLEAARVCLAERERTDLTALEWLEDEAELLRFHILRVTEARAQGLDVGGEAGIIKLVASELNQRVMRLGMDIGCPAHEEKWRRLYLHSHCESIAGGSSEMLRNIIATRTLGLPRSW
ncbi:acyl-CoA dehydrogenase family protein [Streptosporangium sp. NPDC051022]|uniref:acyl-CoA dehydrogenase family protein n=1 Tax=Streptosporangium sp. NPDC051022 TaxID=3155752 RepID=UPI00342A5F50